MEEASVKNFYKGKNIFITGATGFVGTALVEKLLRCIPEIGTIYLLIRPKKGKDVNERLEEYKKNCIFQKICTEQGTDVFNKLKAVAGDVGEENLGLSEEDKKLLTESVHIAFHSAATLDFEASLKTTTVINLLGTRRVIQLCKEMKHLLVLLHVSSAYVNANLKEAEEVIYPAPEKPDKVIELVSSLNDQALEEMTPTVLGSHVNTYTFTKALAEHEVAASNSSFPTCIVRPSQITGVWKDPIAGWTTSKNGPQGFLMGISKGVVRRLPLDTSLICDYIPVDIVVNGMIVGARSAALSRTTSTLIYHLTSGTSNPFKWEMICQSINDVLHKYPLKNAIWYPYVSFTTSLLLFKLSTIIFHFLPAFILDFVTQLSGRRPILVKLHKNVYNSLERLKPFIFNEWKFYNTKALELHQSLNEDDRETFGIDIKSLHWVEYFEQLALGVREFLNNEKMSTVEAGRKKDKILWILNILIQFLFLGFLSCLFLMYIGFSTAKCLFTFPILAGLFSVL